MEALLNIAVSNAVGAALLAVIASIVSRFCRRPVARHALWLLVLLKLITPPLLPVSVAWPRAEEAERPTAEAPLPAFDLPSVSETSEDNIALPKVSEAAVPAADPPPAAPLTFAEIGMPLVFAVWLAGSVVWWTLAAARLRKFQRWLRQARPASAEVQEQARRLAVLLGVRRCPPVVFVSAPLSPLLWALGLSPRLLLPSELWPRLGSEQQDTLLAHELAHLRRGDHWIRHLELLVLGLYWWHPVVWWARRRLQEAEEECCDALVLAVLPDAASAYAAALVETVAFLSQARAAVLVGASGAGQVPLLKRRLTMILTETSARKPSRLAFWIVLGLGALLLPLAPGAAKPEGSEPYRPAEPAPRQVDQQRDPLLAHVVHSCTNCHVAQSVHTWDLQAKPQSWKEIHDEIIRLADEVSRLKAQSGFKEGAKNAPVVAPMWGNEWKTQSGSKEAAKGLPAAAPDRSEEIEKLKDEIELLKLKVQLKDARRNGTQTRMKEIRRRYDVMEETNKRTPGAIPKDVMMEVWIAYTDLKADAAVQDIEWKEATLLLQQAERRLARLQRPAEKAENEGRAQEDKRLQELEQKVERLLKEIQNLRRQKQPNKPRVPGKREEEDADLPRRKNKPRDPDPEHKEVRGFIDRVWPTLDTARLEDNIPKAQMVFQKCKAVGDRLSIQKLLKGTEGHADRLRKEMQELRPDIIADDVEPARKLKKVSEQIVKLSRDIEDYLKAHADDK